MARGQIEIALSPNLEPLFTPVKSPESNGMAEAFVKTFKRDYVRITALQGADTALALIENWMEDYNTVTRTRDWVTVHPASTSLHNRNPLCVRSDRVNSTFVKTFNVTISASPRRQVPTPRSP